MLKSQDLTHYRTIGDEPADLLILQLIETEGMDFVRNLMPFLSNYQDLSFQNQPLILRDFLAENSVYPSFFDKKKLIRATDFHRENQQNIGLVLGLYSLPYCYLGADGAKVLYWSERIKNDTHKRLQETGAFLKAVMNYENWINGDIFAICLKVRLLHAAIRYFTLSTGRWNKAWGYPINQEDMVGTNLAFSLIVLRGLHKLGRNVTEPYETAYLNNWNVIGAILGVKPDLLPNTYKEAVKLDKLISERNFRQSTESKELTASLMNTIRAFAPNDIVANLLQEQSRFLLGEKYAEMLDIKETNMSKSLFQLYHTTSVLRSIFF
ncbi:MAG: oxygenase MpaB family protein [Bacteroidota bacterium]